LRKLDWLRGPGCPLRRAPFRYRQPCRRPRPLRISVACIRKPARNAAVCPNPGKPGEESADVSTVFRHLPWEAVNPLGPQRRLVVPVHPKGWYARFARIQTEFMATMQSSRLGRLSFTWVVENRPLGMPRRLAYVVVWRSASSARSVGNQRFLRANVAIDCR
jgi:hypothetical protein